MSLMYWFGGITRSYVNSHIVRYHLLAHNGCIHHISSGNGTLLGAANLLQMRDRIEKDKRNGNMIGNMDSLANELPFNVHHHHLLIHEGFH